jgi:phosphate transport system permease protein
MHAVWFICAISSIIGIFFILIFLLYDALPVFMDIGIIPFFSGERWDPTSVMPKYGLVPLIVGTLLVTIGAMVFAVPFGIACAIYISEMASPRMRKILKPAIELLAGIPSVVYGFFGLAFLVKFLQDALSVPRVSLFSPDQSCLGLCPFRRLSVCQRMPSVRFQGT